MGAPNHSLGKYSIQQFSTFTQPDDK